MSDGFGTATTYKHALCFLDIRLVRAGIQIPTSRWEAGFAENNSESVILGYRVEKGSKDMFCMNYDLTGWIFRKWDV